MATGLRTYEDSLNPEKGLVFRIVHIDNVPWILDNGLPSGNSQLRCAGWVPIGKTDLINSRAQHVIRHPGAGLLGDYVPFYFTPFSPMLLNIKSGHNGVIQRRNEDIVILVSDLYTIQKRGLPFIFTNGHAYAAYTQFYTQLEDLKHIDWRILQQRDFRRDQEDPHKMDRYQAEALVRDHMPVTALRGIVCYTGKIQQALAQLVEGRRLQLQVLSKSGWYF